MGKDKVYLIAAELNDRYHYLGYSKDKNHIKLLKKFRPNLQVMKVDVDDVGDKYLNSEELMVCSYSKIDFPMFESEEEWFVDSFYQWVNENLIGSVLESRDILKYLRSDAAETLLNEMNYMIDVLQRDSMSGEIEECFDFDRLIIIFSAQHLF